VANSRDDALLSLLHPAWQAVIAGFLLVITVLGIGRLALRGPGRVRNGMVVAGFLIVAITVIGTMAVSCSTPSGSGNAESR
jgi:hypothetical protein